MASRYFEQKLDVNVRLYNIMGDVHKVMKTTMPPRNVTPAIPAPIAQIPTTLSVQDKKSAKKKTKSRRFTGEQHRDSIHPSIPVAKAQLDRKSHQILRKGLNGDDRSFTYQKRIREILQQKIVLESMLLEHKKLQRDRQNIALDIQRMRNDLDKIRQKLDVSLKVLNATKTISSKTTGSKPAFYAISVGSNIQKRPAVNNANRKTASKVSIVSKKRCNS